MKYTVVWMPDAEAELTRIWNASIRKRIISEAADRIESELQSNPEAGQGAVNKRVLIIRPLAVAYELIHDDRLVRVHYVSEETN